MVLNLLCFTCLLLFYVLKDTREKLDISYGLQFRYSVIY